MVRTVRASRRAAAAVVLVAVGLAAGVFGLRLAFADSADAVLVLLTVPVALVAIVLGRLVGLAAAGAAIGMVALYHLAGHPVGVSGYVSRASAFVSLGFGLGSFSDYVMATQSRLAALLDGTLDAVTVGAPVWDATGAVVDGRVVYANSGAIEFLGRSEAEIIGRRWSELWPASFTPELFSALVEVIETGGVVELTEFEVPLDLPSGIAPVVLDLRARAFGDGLTVAWREVSARLRASRALTAANARFAAAFDQAPLGVLLINPGRVIVRANPAFGAIVGRRPDYLVGMSLDLLVDPRDLADSRSDFAGLMAGDMVVSHRERRLVTVDGDRLWVAVSASLIADDDGVYVVAHVEDIHERKSLEGRLQYLADHDPLTGLFNRRRFHEALTYQAALDSRYGRSSFVALVDLDNFKYINDTLGHAAGDGLIQAIARALTGRMRASDVLGRLGGDEFGVLLPAGGRCQEVCVRGIHQPS